MKPTQACRPENLHYLKMLARQYPTVQAASTEIINLQAILNLPKGTEHFVSDVHGEYEAFLHILNSASGVVREKAGRSVCRHRLQGGAGSVGHPDLLPQGEAGGDPAGDPAMRECTASLPRLT